MSFSDNSSESSDSFRKKTKDKPIPIISKTDKKYYKQKFCESWVDRFKPWLTRVQGSPDKAYCTACKTLVKAKKYHIQRHGHTSKHYSNLQKYLAENGLPQSPIKQNLGQRKERKKQAAKVKEPMPVVSVPFENVFMDENCRDEEEIIYDNPTTFNEKMNQSQIQTTERERKNLLLQIQKDNHDLVSTFCGHFPAVPVEKKDHVDSFLDSVGSSVKVLPAKLISEAKLRIAQLIYELELRVITDLESEHPETSNSTKKKTDGEESLHEEQDINDPKNKTTEKQNERTKRNAVKQKWPSPKTNVSSLIQKQFSNPPIKKDHIESFCDSIASSIKVLPRKIISEAKLRISELICELEIRADEMVVNYQQSENNIQWSQENIISPAIN